MTEPTPRQVLYALIAGGFVLVVGVLILGAAFAGVVPSRWTALAGIAWVAITAYIVMHWRRTRVVLGLSILFFAVWIAVTLLASAG